MNMHIIEAGSIPTQAQIIAINERLGKNAKPEKVAKHRLLWIRQEPIEHVKAWMAWKITQSDHVLPMEYIKALCVVHGVTLDQIHRRKGRRHVVAARDEIIQSTAARYPHFSSTKLGQLFKRDHTSILYCLWKVRGKTCCYKKKTMTMEKAIEVRRRWAAGEMGKDIAKAFGISSGAVSSIIHNKRWRVELPAGVAA
ncbi:HNH endonuclease protein [Rhizobium phage RHph_N3_2]|nr:HNH endonuclease protein [Rhizobium phage RHph_N3_2]